MEIKIWENKSDVQKLFAPKLKEQEFDYFMGLGKLLGANPFTREIWAVKYKDDQPASIFLGRDFYRRKAQELPEYDGHQTDAVYSNDKFFFKNGEVNHDYNIKDRGILIGAYCLVFIKNRKPYYVFVDLKEYDKGFSNWKSMPATMIKKVAEAQALRGAFQGTFAGTYDESEQWQDAEVIHEQPKMIETKPQPETKPQIKKELPVMDIDHPKFESAIKSVAEGKSTIEMIKKHFNITEEVESQLIEAQNGNKTV